MKKNLLCVGDFALCFALFINIPDNYPVLFLIITQPTAPISIKAAPAMRTLYQGVDVIGICPPVTVVVTGAGAIVVTVVVTGAAVVSVGGAAVVSVGAAAVVSVGAAAVLAAVGPFTKVSVASPPEIVTLRTVLSAL